MPPRRERSIAGRAGARGAIDHRRGLVPATTSEEGVIMTNAYQTDGSGPADLSRTESVGGDWGADHDCVVARNAGTTQAMRKMAGADARAIGLERAGSRGPALDARGLVAQNALPMLLTMAATCG